MKNYNQFINSMFSIFISATITTLLFVETTLADNPGRYPLETTADAYIAEDVSSSNYGNQPFLFVGTNPEFGYPRRAFLRFDHTPLPDDAVIGSATLHIYMHHFVGDGSVSLSISTVTERWVEVDPGGITWRNQPAANFFSSSDITAEEGLKAFDVTTIVQGWVNGTIPNYGIRISALDESGPHFSRGFYSRESGREGCRPYIEVTYTTNETPPVAPSAPLCGPRTDTTPPEIRIVASPDPAKGGNPVEVTAEVTDDVGLYRVQLYRGAELVADEEDRSGRRHLIASENITLERGIYQYSALAYDNEMNGVSASMLLQVYPSGAPPRIWADHEPLHPDVGDIVTFTARTEFENPVRHLTIFLDGSPHDFTEVLEGHLMIDHVHMLVSIPPKYSVSQVIGFSKGKSAIHIAHNYLGHRRNFSGQQFWARGYHVSTVGRDEQAVREYIRPQEKEDRRIDQLSLFK